MTRGVSKNIIKVNVEKSMKYPVATAEERYRDKSGGNRELEQKSGGNRELEQKESTRERKAERERAKKLQSAIPLTNYAWLNPDKIMCVSLPSIIIRIQPQY